MTLVYDTVQASTYIWWPKFVNIKVIDINVKDNLFRVKLCVDYGSETRNTKSSISFLFKHVSLWAKTFRKWSEKSLKIYKSSKTAKAFRAK